MSDEEHKEVTDEDKGKGRKRKRAPNRFPPSITASREVTVSESEPQGANRPKGGGCYRLVDGLYIKE